VENPAYTRHLKDVPLTELIEMGEHVERLIAHPGFQAVKDVIGSEIQVIDRQLDGAARDAVQDYAFSHGRRGGLKGFEEAARAVIREAKEQHAKAERQAEQVAG